jgi:hypothetical protein
VNIQEDLPALHADHLVATLLKEIMDVCSRLHFGRRQIGIVDPEICSLGSGSPDMVARAVGGVIGRIVIIVITARDVIQIE